MGAALLAEWERFAGPDADGISFERFLVARELWTYCRECKREIDPYDVRRLVESGGDPRDYDWTCEACE